MQPSGPPPPPPAMARPVGHMGGEKRLREDAEDPTGQGHDYDEWGHSAMGGQMGGALGGGGDPAGGRNPAALKLPEIIEMLAQEGQVRCVREREGEMLPRDDRSGRQVR